MATVVSLSASVSGSVFWGWGFDKCREKATMTWDFMAVLTVVVLLLEELNVLGNCVVLTITLCYTLACGGYVSCIAHMLHHSDGSEMNSSAAFNVLLSLGYCVVILMHVISSSALV